MGAQEEETVGTQEEEVVGTQEEETVGTREGADTVIAEQMLSQEKQ